MAHICFYILYFTGGDGGNASPRQRRVMYLRLSQDRGQGIPGHTPL